MILTVCLRMWCLKGRGVIVQETDVIVRVLIRGRQIRESSRRCDDRSKRLECC